PPGGPVRGAEATKPRSAVSQGVGCRVMPILAVHSPLALAQIIARNIVPVAGILLFGWSAPNVLMLYFIDTMLSLGVIAMGVARHALPPPTDEGWAARANAEGGYVGVALMIIAVLAIPMGVPLIFMLVPSGADWRVMLADRSLHIGIALQIAATCWSGFGLVRALRTHTPDQLHLKRRSAFVFLRWLVLLMATYTGIFLIFGHYSALFFVVLYVATSIVIDVAPERFLHAMPGGDEIARSEPAIEGETRAPRPPAAPSAPPKPPHRHRSHRQ
ncbi:MAG: hypothetical protein ABIP49_08040, partial [Lysobacterales bacterium]